MDVFVFNSISCIVHIIFKIRSTLNTQLEYLNPQGQLSTMIVC